MIECSRCASRNSPSDVFCGACGAYLAWSGSVLDPVAPAAPAEVEAVAPAGPRTLAASIAAPSGRACTSCGRINLWHRRFCGRCGQRLVHSDDLVGSTRLLEPVLAPWWMRLAFWRWPRGARIHPVGTRPGQRAPREGPDVELPSFDGRGDRARATWRRVWPDVLVGIIIVVIVGTLIPPIRESAAGAVRNRTPLPAARPVSCGEPVNRANLLPAFPAAFACDGSDDTSWVTPLGTAVSPSQLVVQFARTLPNAPTPALAVDLAAIRFISAVPPPDYVIASVGRPLAVRLDFYATEDITNQAPIRSITIPDPAGTGPYGPLKDERDGSRYTLGPCIAGVKAVVVTFSQAFPDVHTGAPAANVFVSSVEFFRPRSACGES